MAALNGAMQQKKKKKTAAQLKQEASRALKYGEGYTEGEKPGESNKNGKKNNWFSFYELKSGL